MSNYLMDIVKQVVKSGILVDDSNQVILIVNGGIQVTYDKFLTYYNTPKGTSLNELDGFHNE